VYLSAVVVFHVDAQMVLHQATIQAYFPFNLFLPIPVKNGIKSPVIHVTNWLGQFR